MPRFLSSIPTLVLFVALTSPAAAVTVVVPDDHPTIQAALDAGADVIQVRDGLVPERIKIAHHATIERAELNISWLGGIWASLPSVRSIEMAPDCPSESSPQVRIRGVRFLGKVDITGCAHVVVFEGCRFDSGFVASGFNSINMIASVRGCTILGNASIGSEWTQFVGNTVIGAKVSIRAGGSHDIRANYLLGPSDVGLELNLRDSGGEVAENTIRGTGVGIRMLDAGGAPQPLRHNEIADCDGNGIDYSHQWSESPLTATCDTNRIVNCGGAGIAIRTTSGSYWNSLSMRGNVILGSGQQGVVLENTIAYPVRGNTILDSSGDGFVTTTAAQFEGNVIGRSGGAGLKILLEPATVLGNTLFSNAGAGIHLVSSYSGDSVLRNISAFNGGPGILLEGGDAPVLGCNDWFVNAGGPTVGITPGATDLFLHPIFCDVSAADVHLAANSPLLNAGDCGLIGALGQGCNAITAVEPSSTPSPRGFLAFPVPSRGIVAFSLPPSPSPVELEVFDVAGARRWQSMLPAGTTAAQWDRRESTGRSAAPGVYFARLRRDGAEIARVRIVLTE